MILLHISRVVVMLECFIADSKCTPRVFIFCHNPISINTVCIIRTASIQLNICFKEVINSFYFKICFNFPTSYTYYNIYYTEHVYLQHKCLNKFLLVHMNFIGV